MRSKSILTLLAAGAVSLGVVTGASAGNATGEDLAPAVAVGPAEHGGVHNEGGKPENPGQPGDPGAPDGAGDESDDHGRPEVTGRPANAGLHELPEQASAQAKATVAAAFERHEAIRSQLGEIRLILPGRERGEAVSALMGDFAELFRLAGDAVGDEGAGDA